MNAIFVSVLIVCNLCLVTSFSWKSCSDESDPVKVTSLDITLVHREMYITGKGKSAINITNPIKAEVVMRKKFFWGWTVLPCVDQVGSCTYDDICQLTPYLEQPCPQEFTDSGIPCKCPILEGQYAIKHFPVNMTILPHWIEQGRYNIKLSLTSDKKELICMIINIDL